MRYQLLGRTGLRVSRLSLGAMTFCEQGGVGAPAAECRRRLDSYADAGGNVIDTAINYRGTASEAPRPGSWPGPIPWPNGGIGRPSPPCRCPPASCSDTPNATCRRWPSRSA